MAIEFVGSVNASTTGTSLSVSAPAEMQPGDLRVLVVRSWSSERTWIGGVWTQQVANTSRGGGSVLEILTGFHEEGHTPGPYGMNFAAAGNHHANLLVFRGVDPENPVNATAQAYDTTGTNHATPGLTTTVAGTTIVRAVATGLSGSSNSCSWPSTATERSDTRSSAGYSYISTATETREFPGAIGAVTATYSATAYGIMATIALKPAPEFPRRMHLGATAVPLMLGGTEVEIAPSVPASAPSGGSGGVMTDRQNEWFTLPGVAGLACHVWAAHLITTRPIGLMVYLSGSRPPEYDTPDSPDILGGANGIVARAKAKNMLVVFPYAGNYGSWSYPYSEGDGAASLAALTTHLRGQYNIDAHREWFVAVGGGAQFLTRHYLPTKNASVTGGGAVMFRGGGENATTLAPFGEELLPRFTMHWLTGLGDEGSVGGGQQAIEAALEGEAWYHDQGFITTIQTPAGPGDWTGTYGARVGAVLDAYIPA